MTVTGLQYLSYSTGFYGPAKKGGITLQFTCDDTGENYHAICNVDLERKRCTAKHNKGSRLPHKHFSPPNGGAFVAMWKSTQLVLPKSLTAFHDCMGKLKQITFQAEVTKGARLNASTLRPMRLPDNIPITSGQLPDKNRTNSPDNNAPKSQVERRFEAITATCESNCVISKQVSRYTRNPIGPIDETKRVQNQTSNEWLAQYEEQWVLECDELF